MRYFKKVNRRIFPIAFAVVFLAAVAGTVLQQPERLMRLKHRLFPQPTPAITQVKGIGVLGDSMSDEYQGDEARGFQYGPTTLNWVEQLVKSRKVNFGLWGEWGDIRRTGFAYNWSRSGANSNSIIVNEQDVGLAQAIKEGEINFAIIYVGINDFAPHNQTDGYIPIYTGSLSDEALTQKIDRTVNNIETAVDVVKTAGRVNVLLVTIPDWNLSVPLQLAPIDNNGKERVSNAIRQVNKRLSVFAKQQHITLVDSNAFYQTQLARAPLGSLTVGTEQISLLVPGDDPRQAFLSDGAHPGTVLNGLFANYVIEHMNKAFFTDIAPLTDEEILRNAGLQ